MKDEKKDFELTLITFDPDSVRPKVFVELNQAWLVYRRHEITFAKYLKETEAAIKNKGSISNLEKACLAATTATFTNIDTLEQKTNAEANLFKNKAIEAIDSKLFEVLNQKSVTTRSPVQKKNLFDDISKYYAANKALFPLLTDLSQKTKLRDMTFDMMTGRECDLETAIQQSYDLLINHS